MQTPDRFHSLDALRGVAALSVVFWHWQHFGVGNPWPDALFPFYVSGWRAVDLFFVLSGFIFFWLYGERISSGAMDWRTFFVLRMSRLYPLHFATLLVVAAGQWIYIEANGRPFVYLWNDAWHFFLNLLFAQKWGLEQRFSFNGPSWSVSVEVLLYAAFFVALRWLPMRAVPIAMLAFIGLEAPDHDFNRYCLGIFFVGGLTYLAYRQLVGRLWVERFLRVAVLLAWGVTLVSVRTDITLDAFMPTPGWSERFAVTFLFPLTVLYLALAETRRGSLWRKAAWLGDISYSSYLLHFPLALVGVLLFPRAWFASPIALLLFFAVLIPLSLASHQYFEMPAQRWMRQRWGAGHRKAAARAPSGQV